jgi:hypothetical protein
MAISGTKFNDFVDDLYKGVMNLSSDTIKLLLTNTAPVVTNHVYGDILGEVASGNGYTTGGATVSGTGVSNSSGTESLAAAATEWISVTGDMGPFRYFAYYDSTPATKTLIQFYDYGSELTLHGANGDTFTVTPSGGVIQTAS